jgi:competence protein ComEC
MSSEPPAAPELSWFNSSPSVWLIIPTLALLAGQAAATAPWAIPAQAVLLAPLALILVFSPATRRWGLLLFLAALVFTVGYVRHRQLIHPTFPANHLRSIMQSEERVFVEGSLLQEPEKLPDRIRWLVRGQRVWHPTGSEEITGDILINVRAVRREWRYGDRVRFWIRPVLPRDAGNPGGFNYAAFLAARGIYATGFLDNDNEVELVARSPGPARNFIETIRRQIRRFIDRQVSPANGPLMKALVVGDMGELSKEVRGSFTAAGVNHVLSISGLHVSMLGLVVFALVRFGAGFNSYLVLRWNLLKVATFCSFLAVVFYTALAGAMVPTLRSAIMIGVYELAVLLDREEEVYSSLALAALLIGLVWPGVIADISFQLSFLAVLFIVWGMRKIQGSASAARRDELPQEKSWLKEKLRLCAYHLAVPLFATLGTGPLIAHYFGHLSLAGFVANPVIVPLVGLVVVPLGLVVGMFAVVLPEAAMPFVWLDEKLLGLTIWLTDWFAAIPLANISVPAPNGLEVAGLYLFILTVMALRWNRSSLVAVTALLVLLAADGFYWWRQRWNRSELRITHLNVGQGDAAVVELPGSKVMLIDAGGTAFGDFDTGEAIVAPFLRSRKILKVDYLVVSHARVDHYGGMRTLVHEFAPSEFWSGAARGTTRRFEDLEEALDRGRIARVALDDRQPCRAIDAVKICVLYPPLDKSEDASVVLRLEFGKIRVLFPGDIDKRDEKLLALKAEELSSAIVKVPRHGSATASSVEFVTAVKPQVAIVSAGAGNAGRAGRDEVQERYREAGAEILGTDQDGAIIVETDGRTVRYQGVKSQRRGSLSF